MKGKNKNNFPYKVVIIGNSGVAKTCIMAQFINNKFDKNIITSFSCQFIQKILEFPD